MDPIKIVETVIGSLGGLAGLYVAYKMWLEGRLPDRKAWRQYCKSIIQSHDEPLARFPYARVEGAIALECTLNRDPRTRDLIDFLVHQCTSLPVPRPVLILGEYGQGKTVACGEIANRLAAYSLKNRKAPKIPILVRLQNTADISNVNQLASRSIASLYNLTIEEPIIARAANAGHLVFILDGADEYLGSATKDDAYSTLRTLAQEGPFRSNCLVISARPNLLGVSHAQHLTDVFDILRMNFPRLSQIFDYLKRHQQIGLLSIAQRPGNEHFAELIKRPLFLDMAVATADLLASDSTLTDARLFDRYFEAWYLRELSKLGPNARSLSRSQVELILSSAAHTMFSQGKAWISEEEFAQLVDKIADTNIRSELDNLKNQARNRLLLVPDERLSEKQLSFRHESLSSYFLSNYLWKQMLKEKGAFSLPNKLDSLTLSFFVTQASATPETGSILSVLYQKDVVGRHHHADIMGATFLLWALRNSPRGVDIEYFRDFCRSAGDDVRMMVLSHLRNVDLSGLDLSDFNFKGAVLQNSTLCNTVFRRTDLTNARLDGANLTKSLFDQTLLSYVSFKYATLSSATFQNLDSTGTVFQEANFGKSTITACNFTRADFSRAQLESSRISHVSNQDCNFAGAILNNLELCEDSSWIACDLTGAGFQGTSCTRCSFEGSDVDNAVGLSVSKDSNGKSESAHQ